LLRLVSVLTPDGPREVAILDSLEASLVAEHWNAAHKYLQTGDASITSFAKKQVHGSNGVSISLLTDLSELDRLGNAGVLSFESLYARAS
jgi:hypothetical protein